MAETKEVTEIGALKTALTEQFTEMKALVEKRDAEIKAQGEANEATGKLIKEADERIQQMSADFKGMQETLAELEKKAQRPGYGGEETEYKTAGELFAESEQLKQARAAGKYRTDLMPVKSFYGAAQRKATLTSDPASGGALIQAQRFAGLIAPPNRPMRIRDLFTVRPTTSNSIEYVEESGFTNAAAPVAEAPSSANAKPESALTFELKSANVKTIAHWIPASRQVLDDAGQLRAYIDGRLIYGLEVVEEAQLLYGNGTGANLQGILTHPDRQQYGWSDGEVGDNKVDAIRRAMTLVRLAEYPSTGIVLHPTDWEDIELLKGSDGHYIWVNVTQGGESRLWRAPVVDTTAIQAGQFAVGAFDLAAYLWDREQAGVRVSEDHADFFTRNMVAILAEERLALTIFRPEAFVHGNFDAAPEAPAGE